jgi:hypothetical protein
MNATERAKVLDRLAAGEITAAEAMRLLDGSAQAEPVKAVQEESWPAADEIPVEELKAEALKIELPDETVSLKKAAVNGDASDGGKPRWLKIRVSDRATGHSKVNVTLPIGLVSFGLGVARHLGADIGGMGTDELLSLIKTEQRGMLVEVNDEEDDEQVLIYLE